MRARNFLTLSIVLGALGPAAASCANTAKREPAGEDLGDSGITLTDSDPLTDTAPPPIDGLKSIALDPPSAALTLTWPIAAPAKQDFKAIGTFEDGTTKDVTAAVAWSVSTPSAAPINIAKGSLTASAPAKVTVTAQAGAVVGTGVAVIKLTGNVVGAGVPADAVDKMAGASTGSVTVAYPLDGSLVPYKLGPLEFQVQKSDSAQSLARVEIKGDALDLRFYGACTAVGANGCAVTLDDALAPVVAGASEGDSLKTTVRLATATYGSLAESAPVEVRWTFSSLSGGLYYWRAYDHDKSSGVARFDLDQPGKPAEKYFQSDLDSPPLASGDAHPCVGCHAISPDGKKMGLTFGGSDPSAFGLLDIAKKEFIAKKVETTGYATATTFSPDGSHLVNMFRGVLKLRVADSTLADVGGPLFESLGEKLGSPYWSGDGKTMVFVSWKPSENGASASVNGDLVRGGQIWVVDSDGASFPGAPKLIVPRVPNRTETYPATSDDSKYVVFNETRCDGPPTPGPYGNDPCDGYDDPSAKLRLVPIAGGAPVDLVRASGDQNWASSWPRFSPSHKTFRGKNLYWVAFSSRRPYGLRLAGSVDGSTKPQLWFAAVLVDDSGTVSGDPSMAPVWLPGQNDADATSGNHVPQWVTVAVPVIK